MNQANFLYQESRRAIRLGWKRPVCIVQPTRRFAYAVNVSATGILIDTTFDERYRVGANISITIPHINGTNRMVVNGQIVRAEMVNDKLRLGVNLIQ